MDTTDHDPLAELMYDDYYTKWQEALARISQLEHENAMLRAESRQTVINIDTTAVAAALQPWIETAPQFMEDMRNELRSMKPTMDKANEQLARLVCQKRKKDLSNAMRGSRKKNNNNYVSNQSRIETFYYEKQ